MTVSLPNNMCGVVAISDVSDPITEGMENEMEEGEAEGGEGDEEEEVSVNVFDCSWCDVCATDCR